MITIDNDIVSVTREDGSIATYDIGSPEGFRVISRLWLRSGWDNKYVYSFTWLGRPIIQLPDDMVRLQELIYRVKPDVIIDIGIAHGGSLVFAAGLCRMMGKGRVIGVDIEIRPVNRAAIEQHELASLITMLEGNSISKEVITQVRSMVSPSDVVLVCLDGCHTRDHVYAEMEAYGPLVSSGSYIVAMDGIMRDLVGAPRSSRDWATNNPAQAAQDFVASHPEYQMEEPPLAFNEGSITERVTYWPHAFVRRL
jgi:cephalosporin hydroxylase